MTTQRQPPARRQPPVRRQPPATYRRLARLCLRHKDGDYYEVAERLVQQLELPPSDAQYVKQRIAYYLRAKEND